VVFASGMARGVSAEIRLSSSPYAGKKQDRKNTNTIDWIAFCLTLLSIYRHPCQKAKFKTIHLTKDNSITPRFPRSE
ncbi:MAG: hypothetical protein KAR12_10660, partial [Methylococcales bacterium]|nr:hypothetical protein [Methylococcales bacterium]